MAVSAKTSPARTLRAWQQQALQRYHAACPENFLVVATPGAGKTTFGLTVTTELLTTGVVEQVLIVVPTKHLKAQWTRAAAGFGLRVDPAYVTGRPLRGHGAVVTYAQIATDPGKFAAQLAAGRVVVLLDEVHHAGDNKSWGAALRTACDPAVRRLLLTGTPFRSDEARVPFVTYVPHREGGMRSRPDFVYGYGDALADRVVRPVVFPAYGGHALWQEGELDVEAVLDSELLDETVMRRAWRTVLDPKGRWMPAVLTAAHQRLRQVRERVPDAGGLVIAGNQRIARSYAAMLGQITGGEVTLVLSSDPQASDKIAEFAATPSAEWMVAVRMVSEGVDVPRLAVGVYATTYSTPLFFAQAVGRFVRARDEAEVATVFIPAVPVLMELAERIAQPRDHEVPEHEQPFDPDDEEPQSRGGSAQQAAEPLFVPLDSWADLYVVIGLRGVWCGQAADALAMAVATALARCHDQAASAATGRAELGLSSQSAR